MRQLHVNSIDSDLRAEDWLPQAGRLASLGAQAQVRVVMRWYDRRTSAAKTFRSTASSRFR